MQHVKRSKIERRLYFGGKEGTRENLYLFV